MLKMQMTFLWICRKTKNNIRFIVQVYDESLGGHLYILFDRLIPEYAEIPHNATGNES